MEETQILAMSSTYSGFVQWTYCTPDKETIDRAGHSEQRHKDVEVPARTGATSHCRYDSDVPDINLHDEYVRNLFREIGLGREIRLTEQPKIIYCALYHVINDYDTTFKKEDLMHWCLLIALMIYLGCTENMEDKERFKYYFDLFHYWFPHEFEECSTFKWTK